MKKLSWGHAVKHPVCAGSAYDYAAFEDIAALAIYLLDSSPDDEGALRGYFHTPGIALFHPHQFDALMHTEVAQHETFFPYPCAATLDNGSIACCFVADSLLKVRGEYLMMISCYLSRCYLESV